MNNITLKTIVGAKDLLQGNSWWAEVISKNRYFNGVTINDSMIITIYNDLDGPHEADYIIDTINNYTVDYIFKNDEIMVVKVK